MTVTLEPSARPSIESDLSARFEREIPPLIGILMNQALRKTNNRADAEDLLQDTLIHAYTGFRTFEPGSNLKAWMFRIMANQCINTFRKKERRPSEYLADDISDYPLCQPGLRHLPPDN